MELSIIIDWILRIVGILSIFKIIINILFCRKVWRDDVEIKRKQSIESECDEFEYKHIYYFEKDNTEVTIISGKIYPIKKIEIYESRLYKNKIKKGKLIYSYNNLFPDDALFLKLYYGCTMPIYIIKIKSHNYENTEIFLSENGFNGNVDYKNGILYKKNLISIIYQLFFE